MPTEDSSRSPLWDAEIIGGPREPAVVIVDWDPSWTRTFQIERERIRDALGSTAVRIDHVGSTAVEALPAKPIVDIQVSVGDVENERTYEPQLEQAGYELRVREPGHRMFRTRELDVHVHLCELASSWERRHLLFRDWLRESPTDLWLYADTKRRLAERDWPTMNHYADAKTDVIAAIMQRAEAWARSSGWVVRDDR